MMDVIEKQVWEDFLCKLLVRNFIVLRVVINKTEKNTFLLASGMYLFLWNEGSIGLL